MDAYRTDVLVVGAGPAGSNAARLLAGSGHRVVVVEEDPVVGEPLQCAGLVTPKVFDLVPFGTADVAINWIRGATIYSPSGQTLSLDSGRRHALVMDRSGFDRRLAAAAVDAGAELWTRSRFVSASVNGRVVARVERQDPDGRIGRVDVQAQLLIGADGVQSNVGRQAGLPRPREFLAAYEAEMDGLRLDDTSTIPVFTDQRLAPGFFSWIIPLSNLAGRAGLCMRMRRTSARTHFDAFLQNQHVAPFLERPRVTKPIVGSVPLGMPRRFVGDRVMLVGDACAMPKPTSGGGIWTGVAASQIAADVADTALRRGDLSRARLRAYERRFWRSRIGREIRLGWLLRRAFLSLTNRELDAALRLLSSRRTVGIIDAFGDIDHPSRLVAPLLLGEPRLLGILPRAVRQALRVRRAFD